MHPHLHTETNKACEEVMNALDECHARGFLWKSMGMCNGAKHAVNMCLRQQRLERTRRNREAAMERRGRMQEIWDEVDANT